jgi:hypothetical protein
MLKASSKDVTSEWYKGRKFEWLSVKKERCDALRGLRIA